MQQFNVTGMSCAACQTRVEKAVSAVPGVTSCAVSLLTNSMGVDGTASASDIIKAVTDAGYGASLKGGSKSSNKTGASRPDYEDDLKDTETPKIRKRLIASVIILIPLMYVSMGHMLFNWPLPPFMNGNHVAQGLYQLILTGLIMVINQKFFISGFKGLIHKSPNMDTLVALGSAAAFLYSLYALFAMSSAQVAGDSELMMKLMDEFYFESAATILTLITVGKMLEASAKGRTTNALKSLMKMAPKTAVLLINGEEQIVPIEDVSVGDRFVVKPGSTVPVDGKVVEGNSAINEAALTGESIPVDKAPGDKVSSGTINENGYLVCEATQVGEDTSLAKIIQLVSDSAATKAPIAKIADRVSGVFVPVVISIAVVTFIVWMIVGHPFGFALARAISVLVISCPCALGLATPVAIMVGNGMGAKSGIMFKTSASLEEAGKIQIIALDKTGTITKGEPHVVDYYLADGISEKELFEKAYALEAKSEHPLAKAVVEKAKELGLTACEVLDFTALPGNGLKGNYNGVELAAGNAEFIKTITSVSSEISSKATEFASKGMTPLFFAEAGKLLGIISVADVIKEDSAEAIKELKNMGIHVVMLTGDNRNTAMAIAKETGIDEVVPGVKPDGKDAVIQKLCALGKTAMVGDGINDAPALTRADIGIAIGAGTDVAIDAADIVVMKSSIKDVASAIRLSRATLKNIHENLFWAFFYNVCGIPLAAGCFIAAFGWELNPMFGAAAMSLSSFFVVMNALRLNLFKMHNASKDHVIKNTLGHEPLLKEEKTTMEITVKGMMCGHCEAHTKKALEAIDGIVSATADHNTDTVVIETSGDVSEAAMKAAIEEAGYEYCGIK